MTNEEIKARIEANETKVARAIALIEKCEKKAAELKQRAAEMGIVFTDCPAGTRIEKHNHDLLFAVRAEVEAKFGKCSEEANNFYWNIFVKYCHAIEQAESNREKIAKITATIDAQNAKLTCKEAAKIEFEALPEIIKTFLANWTESAIEYYMQHHDNSKNDVFRYRSAEYIKTAIEQDAQKKGIEISRKVAAKCGQITDAAGLQIGMDGTINGRIIGTSVFATVETILAGGHTIQCLHYRVLVK